MQGSVRKQGKNSWRITVSTGWDEAAGRYGKYQETFKGGKKEADKRLAELVDLLNKGYAINPEKITVAEFLERWLAGSAVTEQTRENYGHSIRRHINPALGEHQLAKLKPLHIKELYGSMLLRGYAHNFVRKTHAILHSALNSAVKWEMIYRNPADAVEPPKRKKPRVEVLDETQLAHLLDNLSQPYRVPAYIAAGTGMRLGEVLGLRWQDVDLERGVITVVQSQKIARGRGVVYGATKNKKGRSIDIPDFLVGVLRTHRTEQIKHQLAMGGTYSNTGLVCTQDNGRPLHNSVFSTRFSDVAEDLGYNITFHCLRHTHVSLLLKLGVDLKTISVRVGHAGIGITADTYSHLAPDAQKVAAKKLQSAIQDPNTSSFSQNFLKNG